MPTLNGFIRSYQASVRRSKREQQREAREAAKRYKAQLKQELIENVAESVSAYNDYIELLQSVHKNFTGTVDWIAIENESKPEKPVRKSVNEVVAKERLEVYKPSMSDKLFGRTGKKIEELELAVKEGQRMDEEEFNSLKEEYEDWESLQNILTGVKNRDPESFKSALEYFSPFSDIAELGTDIKLIIDKNQADINLYNNNKELIPNYTLKQTATGKLSKKSMTKSKHNELYQDHVCSLVIRVAREFFAHVPFNQVRVNVITKILNSSTGHLEDKPILSVIMISETINSLNLETIDPSDSMANFVHNMKFSKIKGFSPVSIVELSET